MSKPIVTGKHLVRLPGGLDVRKVMFFGKNMSRTRCTGALVEALEQHRLDVKWINMATLRRWFSRLGLGRRRSEWWVRSAFRRFRPDLVFVFCRDLPLHLLEEFRREAVVVLWMEEALENLDVSNIQYMRHADVVCMSNPAHFDLLRQQGLDNMAFLMSGFSPTYHQPVAKGEPLRDVAFIGGPGRKGQRAPLLAKISEHFDTEIYGPNWDRYVSQFPSLRVRKPVGNREYAEICGRSRVVLGINEVNQDPLYFSNRTWLTLACRGFHLTHYVPGLEEVFADGEHLVWYHDQAEALRKIRLYLEMDDERERIAAAGHRLALDGHRYYHRIAELLRLVQVPRRSERARVQRPLLSPAVDGRLSASPASD